ncbi:hypothetical protein [Loktanella sp. M215]|uniref:hypothetical protein n=1 Tax=Loktanella sp. M215 TaxID=2675431 RepID=UPI001F20B991|nr:hypothetical protein [Loktanella sp. M215]MCF7698145.1 hypothetical protein [Loktanella sp. M215]
MPTFKAAVQYDDLKGTVAVDESDNHRIHTMLTEQGIARADEILVGFRIGSGCVDKGPVDSVSLVVYLSATTFDRGVSKIRAVDIQMTPGEALAYFKRFDLVAVRKDLDVSSAEVDGPHYD